MLAGSRAITGQQLCMTNAASRIENRSRRHLFAITIED